MSKGIISNTLEFFKGKGDDTAELNQIKTAKNKKKGRNRERER